MRRSRLAQFVGVCSLLTTTSVFAWTDYTSQQAYDCAKTQANCYILDVRTNSEWRWVGHPGKNKLNEGSEIEGKVVNISSLIEFGTELVQNPLFIRDVDKAFGISNDDDGGISRNDVTLITMCRSGSRSQAAADTLEAAGYTNVYNMTHGFEGDRDNFGYRTVNGWKVEGFSYNDSALGAYRLGF